MKETENRYGLSRKTNVAIAAIGMISASQNSVAAIIAISLVATLAITYQFFLDKEKNDASD
jgi:hypothetical protein